MQNNHEEIAIRKYVLGPHGTLLCDTATALGTYIVCDIAMSQSLLIMISTVYTSLTGELAAELFMMKVFQQYYAKLVVVLPMDDVVFRARLYSAGLLPHEAKEKMKLMSNQTEMAAYFLDHVIPPSGISGVHFMKLLDVMWSSEDDHVRTLAGLVKSRLTKRVVNSESTCVCVSVSVCSVV